MPAGRKASADAGFRRFMGVHDLNLRLLVCDARGFERPGVRHERGQGAVCAGNGVRSVKDLRTNHRATQGRCWRSLPGLRGLVSRHGLRAAHMARVASRHRGVPGGQPSQAVHMGLKAPPARSTLADALNLRDWRIYHALAQRLIARARALYAQEPSVLELDVSVYALDATTVDLCLSLFDWAPFRSTKAAIKLHTLLDLRGAIPAFIHISDGKLHDVNVLDILPVEAGAFYVMDRGYLDFERLHAMHQAGAFFVTRAKA